MAWLPPLMAHLNLQSVYIKHTSSFKSSTYAAWAASSASLPLGRHSMLAHAYGGTGPWGEAGKGAWRCRILEGIALLISGVSGELMAARRTRWHACEGLQHLRATRPSRTMSSASSTAGSFWAMQSATSSTYSRSCNEGCHIGEMWHRAMWHPSYVA